MQESMRTSGNNAFRPRVAREARVTKTYWMLQPYLRYTHAIPDQGPDCPRKRLAQDTLGAPTHASQASQ
eukprot:3792379-Lingulodinium_polyedra.AAC.1